MADDEAKTGRVPAGREPSVSFWTSDTGIDGQTQSGWKSWI